MKKTIKEYQREFRQYLLDVAEDEGFDITAVEDWETWYEEEKDDEAHRCKNCGGLYGHTRDCKKSKRAGNKRCIR